jgi:hypothetical protein
MIVKTTYQKAEDLAEEYVEALDYEIYCIEDVLEGLKIVRRLLNGL